MRVFELTTRVTSIGRGTGEDALRKPRSATAAAAYRACTVIHCEREGITHDYTRKRGLEVSAIVLPADAPTWAADRAQLWNAAELKERNGKRGKNAGQFKMNAKIAREFMFAFPAELSAAGRLAVAHAIAQHFVDKHGVAADFSIHRPGAEGDERNHHCHMMITTRRLTAAGLGAKAREWDGLVSGRQLGKSWRAYVAKTMNEALAVEGLESSVHVEHRTLKARGSPRRPTRHQGVRRTNRQRRERRQARDVWTRSARADQRSTQAREAISLATEQDSSRTGKLEHLAVLERDGIEAIEETLAHENAADRAAQGLRGAFQKATGAAKRAELERQARADERRREADRQIAALRAGLDAERAAFDQAQAKDRGELADRHKRDDTQLRTALSTRVAVDRNAEVQARRQDGRDAQERQRDLGSRGRGTGSEPGPT